MPRPVVTDPTASHFELLAVSRTATKPVIQALGIDYAYGSGETRTPVLHNVELDIGQGEIVIMTGPSGSGKTTLLTLIGALRRMQTGSLSVLGRNLARLTPRQQVELRKEIGFIFQLHNLFTSLTALENVRMAAILRPDLGDDVQGRCVSILNQLGLEDRIHSLPARLSGGQRQRVAIARALVNRPRLVLADEPTASLDVQSSESVIQLLRRLSQGPDQTTVLLVTHDQRLIDRADRIVHMVDGRIVSNVLARRVIQMVDVLKKVKTLAGLSEATLTRVAEQMTIETRRPGEILVREGAPCDRFFVIGRGTAEAIRDDQVLHELTVGDVFGEATEATGLTLPETIRARSELELYILTKRDFERVMATDKTFEQRIRDLLMSLRTPT